MEMTLYEKLTGKTVPGSQIDFYKAMIKRTQTKLETILGYSLIPKALYNELGKAEQGCVCPDIPESLLPADEVKGIIKVFPYNYKDKFLMIDPFKDVYNAKLVRVLENREFVTYKTFDLITKQFMENGIGKSIERCQTCYCDCDCKDCVLLAVDGDWINITDSDFPEELLYLLCDMVDFYADPAKDIKSESVDGHSWSRGDITAPEMDELNKALLLKYVGPFGQTARIPTL